MKRLATGVIVAMLLLLPAAAWAGASTDAALALGSFAVLNQIIGGTGLFAGVAPAPQPVYYAAPPRIYVAPPPPLYVAPRPVYMAPRPVYVAPRPVYVSPRPVYVTPRPVVVYHGHGGHWHRHRR
jgi:hypothetical protein